ncbi:MAG: hypothetical protein Q9159_003028 [Coniocarpon cinnabarinum]
MKHKTIPLSSEDQERMAKPAFPRIRGYRQQQESQVSDIELATYGGHATADALREGPGGIMPDEDQIMVHREMETKLLPLQLALPFKFVHYIMGVEGREVSADSFDGESATSSQHDHALLDAVQRRKLTTKLDLRLVPILIVLYLMAFLDSGLIAVRFFLGFAEAGVFPGMNDMKLSFSMG